MGVAGNERGADELAGAFINFVTLKPYCGLGSNTIKSVMKEEEHSK